MSSVFPRRAPDYATLSPDPTPRPQLRSAVELAKERLAATQKKLVREKRLLRDVSTRENGIRERAEQIGAKIDLTSQPGGGTTVTVTVPF